MNDAKSTLIGTFLLLIGLAFVWYYTGGPQRPSSHSGPLLEDPIKKYYQQELKKPEESEISEEESFYKYKLILRAGWGARKSEPQEEYIEIKASSNNKEPIKITGLSLEGKSGFDITIGKGSYLPFSGQVNPQKDIYLQPGGKAYIITGESPIGTSFRLNKCTGYFEQFQDFVPRLPKECPYPDEEELPDYLDDKCLDYIESLPRCEIPLNTPYGLSSECMEYITQNINYKACVEKHKKDPDFYKNVWMIYLGRGEELWKNKRETIILKDENGKIIDWDSY